MKPTNLLAAFAAGALAVVPVTTAAASTITPTAHAPIVIQGQEVSTLDDLLQQIEDLRTRIDEIEAMDPGAERDAAVNDLITQLSDILDQVANAVAEQGGQLEVDFQVKLEDNATDVQLNLETNVNGDENNVDLQLNLSDPTATPEADSTAAADEEQGASKDENKDGDHQANVEEADQSAGDAQDADAIESNDNADSTDEALDSSADSSDDEHADSADSSDDEEHADSEGDHEDQESDGASQTDGGAHDD